MSDLCIQEIGDRKLMKHNDIYLQEASLGHGEVQLHLLSSHIYQIQRLIQTICCHVPEK